MYPVVFKKSCFPRQRDAFFSSNDRFRSLFSDGADYSVPAVNIKESEGHFEIEVAAPGQKKEDFRIALEKNMLTISTEKKSQNEDHEGRYTRREFGYSSFTRSFIIPDYVDQDKIKANHNNGVLIVELPKMKPEKSKEVKTIQIS
jgi:HSP20 family protein